VNTPFGTGRDLFLVTFGPLAFERSPPWDATNWASSTVKGAPLRSVISLPGSIAPGRNSALTLPPSRKNVAACHPNERAAKTRPRTAIASVAASKLTLLAVANHPPNLTHKLTHKLARFVANCAL
jgi:hypothetical protein